MKKVLFVATVVKTHIVEFHIPYLKMFKEAGWETAVAARNDYENPTDCNIPYCDNFYNILFERNPLRRSNIKALRTLKKVIKSGNYEIIHCHTPVGALLTRMAAKSSRKKGTRLIYTAHGFHFFKGASAINWLIYYPAEKWLSRYTDVIITINKEDYQRAKRFKAKKLYYVPGVGIDLTKFSIVCNAPKAKREELGIPKDAFTLLSVGELIKRKNHEVVIKALSHLKHVHGVEDIQYLICGKGILFHQLKELCITLEVSDQVHFLGYRNDISEICNCSDLFVFMSFQEGLPVALMEAMACGMPVICSNIRGNTDLIENGINGLVIKNNYDSVADAILEMKNSDRIRMKYSQNALAVISQYSLETVSKEMKKIYFAD